MGGAFIAQADDLSALFYIYLTIKDRTTEYSTAPYIISGKTDNVDAHLVGLNLNYRF
jgi:hypothetical protein